MSRDVELASDRRGRVPFAVVGVLLLVASLALAPTLSTEPAPSDTAVERAMTEVTAASQTAVRDGVATASRRAAASPVVEPADTPVGDALSDDTPFRDSLRLRVYLQVRANLEQLSTRSEGVTATASLPAVDSTDDYERAIDRVTVERAGDNDTALRVTVENVTLTTRRHGEVVGRRTTSPTVVVPSPVLHVQEQVSTYEKRLNNGLGKPGLSQRVTARLYPIAWARGYAQFGGAPIANVIANRHVSLATNGALLGVQRSVFGRSDSDGRQALKEATAVVGLRDIVASSNSEVANQILSRVNYRPASQNITTGGESAPAPDEPMRLGINETADRAFREVGTPDALNATARDAYTVDAKVVTEREHQRGGVPPRSDAPGPKWRFDGEEIHSDAEIVGTFDIGVSVPDGWHALDRFGRTVEITHTREVKWERGNNNHQTTTTKDTEHVRVSLALVGNHRNESLAPVRGFERGHIDSESPLGGKNLDDVLPKAESKLLENGRTAAAKDVALESFQTESISVTGARPSSIHTWIARDLRRLRERVRNITVTTDRGSVGAFQTNPAKRLRQKLRQRRSQLVDAPDTYDSAAARARVAARVEFLDTVKRKLSGQAGNHSQVEANITDKLEEVTGGSLAELRRALTARETSVPRSRPTPTGPAGPVRTRVEAQPQYLTLASVSESQFPAVNGSETPLVARNVNVFTVPYGNAVNEVLNAVKGSTKRVGLGAAARALAAANATAPPGENQTLDSRRSRLQAAVARANGQVIGALRERVSTETDADGNGARQMVSAAMSRWETTAAKGNALANDSAAARIASVVGDRQGLSPVVQDWLRLQLKRTTTQALAATSARPNKGVVNRTVNAVRSAAENQLRTIAADHASKRIEDIAKKRLGRRVLPAGLPLAPPFMPWYLSLNVWWVTVAGEYARFSVTANHGPPNSPGARTTYVREDKHVTVDADGDGDEERLGQNEPVSFRVDTGVVVVVPPRPRGVGDKDGNAVERSGGWPNAG